MTYTVRLTGPKQRAYAHRLIDAAPDYAMVTVRQGDRTLEQNTLTKWQTAVKIVTGGKR